MLRHVSQLQEILKSMKGNDFLQQTAVWLWVWITLFWIRDVQGFVLINNFIAINTCADLQAIRSNLNGDYELSSSIDCSETVGWNSRAGFEPIGDFNNRFRGTFDGRGFEISNLIINRTATDYVGLFGFIESSASIDSVSLVDCLVLGHNVVGGLVGASYGTVSNTYVTGTILGSGNNVGGLVGQNHYGASVINADATGQISGLSVVGGLVGSNDNGGTINNVYATGIVSGSDSSQVGGLVGRNAGAVNNAYATNKVSGVSYIGGLVGYNTGTINDTYATGTISGSSSLSSYVGGLVAYNGNGGSISNSYATGTSTASGTGSYLYAGGLVAYNNNATISNSYATGSSAISTNSYGSNVGGLVAYN